MASVAAGTKEGGKDASRRAFAAAERVYRAGDRPSLGQEVRDLVHFRSLLLRLVHRDLTIRYKRSPLGFLWTMLHPLILMAIFTIVFSTMFRFQLPNYPIYFLSEFVGWTFFSQTVVESMNSMRWNGTLMKQVRVPRTIFVISSTISGLVHMSLAVTALFGVMVVTGAPFSRAMLFLPASFLIIGVFTLGVAMVASALSVFFADVRETIQAFLPALMYLTPVIYPLSIIPHRYKPMVAVNPLLYLFDLLRAPLYGGTLPSLWNFGISVAAAFFSLAIGWMVYQRLSPRFYPHL